MDQTPGRSPLAATHGSMATVRTLLTVHISMHTLQRLQQHWHVESVWQHSVLTADNSAVLMLCDRCATVDAYRYGACC
jgi:hypothetical protein